MSHTSQIFEQQPIRVQNVNGFDLSHIFAGSAIVGTLTPCLSRLLMPETKFTLGAALNVEMPPLASSFFGRIDACIEVFFVPCSILYGGWKQFISGQVATMFPSSQESVENAGGFALPVWQLNEDTWNVISSLQGSYYSLLDYMRWHCDNYDFEGSGGSPTFNLLPLLAYHRIWDVFYRNPQVTKTIFAVNPNLDSFPSSYGTGSTTVRTFLGKNVSLIWHSFYPASDLYVTPVSSERFISAAGAVFSLVSDLSFPDSFSVFSLRQRNYSRDYFTAASVSPQLGNPSKLQFSVDIDNAEGEFTISALRNANSLQKFLEASNYDPTYRGVMRAHFGKTPSDADHDEPTYIGRVVLPVYQKSVYNQNGITPSDSYSSNTKNPYGNILGGRAAAGSFSGEGSICNRFHVGCFGYLIGLFSLVPHTLYAQGYDRSWDFKEIGDFAFPELQSVGMDSIKTHELYWDSDDGVDRDFAYIPRYSYWKYIDDVCAGQLRPGQPLQSFVLQRIFADTPEFGTEFCEIPKSALDGVLPVTEANSHLSCWFEVYWVFKATMPLAAFCVPTLGELQDTHTITTTQGGSRL